MTVPTAPAGPSVLSYAQIEQYWIQAGGPAAVAPIAAAIAIAESTGNYAVVQEGQPYGSTGWGLWQITPGNSYPNIGTDQALLNPSVNAAAAVAKYKNAGNSFKPWTTFTSGAYRQYLQNVDPGTVQTTGAAGPPGSDPSWTTWLNPNSWQAQLAIARNWPITHTTLAAMDAWTLSEDPTGHLNGANNPFAFTGVYPGATKCVAQCGGSSPVMAYATLSEGIQGTSSFFDNNSKAYASVDAAFKNATYQAEQTDQGSKTVSGQILGNVGLLNNIWAAINGSGWCSKCQGGKYPAQLANLTNGLGLPAAGLKALGQIPANVAITGTPVTGYSASQQGAATPTGFSSLVPGLSGLLSLLGELGNAQFWQRLGVGVLGAAFVIGGLIIFMESTDTGKQLTATAAKAALV